MSIMSENDMDALAGRLMREKKEAYRRKAAIEQEIELVRETIERAFRGLSTGDDYEKVLAGLEPVRKFFSVDALRELIEERTQVTRRMLDAIKRLQELGMD